MGFLGGVFVFLGRCPKPREGHDAPRPPVAKLGSGRLGRGVLLATVCSCEQASPVRRQPLRGLRPSNSPEKGERCRLREGGVVTGSWFAARTIPVARASLTTLPESSFQQQAGAPLPGHAGQCGYARMPASLPWPCQTDHRQSQPQKLPLAR